MKYLLSSLFILSLSLPTFARTLSKIEERGTNRSIEFTQENRSLIVTLKDGNSSEVLNTLDYSQRNGGLELKGRGHTYKFEMLKLGLKTTGNIYDWCYSDKAIGALISAGAIGAGGAVAVFASMGAAFPVAGTAILVGVGAGVAVCGVGPALPAAAGIALLPIDLIVTAGALAVDSLNVDKIAAKKFRKALAGKDKKASQKVFNTLINKIEQL